MKRLVLSFFASQTVMGAQVYERSIDERAEAALGYSAGGWAIDRIVIRSLRSSLDGNRRVPMGVLHGASVGTRAGIARLIYPRADVVHRMKVGIPPAPDRDVLTLHDIGPWKFADEADPPSAAREELRRARAIVAPSHFSAMEIAEHFNVELPVVIQNGFDRERFWDAAPLSGDQLSRLGVSGDYVLAAGGASERKNLAGLAQAWSEVHRARPDVTLVLAGPPHPRRTELFRDVRGSLLVGRVDDSIVPGLMAGARAVVVPSLYEGFGLPALEAMAAGVPVVAARASSLPEVLGDAGTLTDPTPVGLAEGMIHALSSHNEIGRAVDRGRKRALEFSWERSAQAHADLWEQIATGQR